jgi:hypothetical protein
MRRWLMQEPSKPVATSERRLVVFRRCQRREEQVVQTLVVPFEMVVLDELAHGAAKMSLTERDQLVQALGLDRQHEALGVCVQVETARRKLDAFDSRSAKDVAELVGKERIPIVDRYRMSLRNPSTLSVRFRATCFIHAPCGWCTIPAM